MTPPFCNLTEVINASAQFSRALKQKREFVRGEFKSFLNHGQQPEVRVFLFQHGLAYECLRSFLEFD